MDRQQALLAWTQDCLNDPECYFKPASNDASFRSYYRVFSRGDTFIIMDAPTQHENCLPFINISEKLNKIGIQVPVVLHQDLKQGFLLLTDLGTVQYLSILKQENFQQLYQDAIDKLHIMQQEIDMRDLPVYSEELLQTELNLFTKWFVGEHLAVEIKPKHDEIIKNYEKLLIDNALEQPQKFVHRDYHSRNLMKSKDNNPGVLDFQDAVIGAVTYDLVSLLRDCYIVWKPEDVYKLAENFRIKYNQLNNCTIDSKQWQTWFDLMGVQRHLKAIGIFCRLNYRDKKPDYLKDINRTLCYVKTTCQKYQELHQLGQFIQEITPSIDILCEH